MTVKAKKRRELRSFRLVTVASAALAAAFLVWIGLGLGGEQATDLVSDLGQATAALVAAWACYNAAKKVQGESIRYTSRGRRSRHLVTKN